MSETTDTSNTDTANEGGEQQQEQGKTYTQAEINNIVTSRLKEQAEKKFGDYAELKARAEGAKTVEQKLADLEAKHAEAEARALRSDIAARHGISTEDRDLFLTGSDEATLEAQASRLAARVVDQKKQGNVARKEGATKTTGTADTDAREFVSTLFGGSD